MRTLGRIVGMLALLAIGALVVWFAFAQSAMSSNTGLQSQLAATQDRATSAETRVKELVANPIVKTETVIKAVEVEKIVEKPVEKIVEVRVPHTVEVPAVGISAQVPMTLTAGRPEPWLASNGQRCDWGVPSGTVFSGETANYIFTNCTSANIKPGKGVEFSWRYSQEDYDFLLNGEKGSEGVAWWGPVDACATVSYDGGKTICRGASFEVLPGVQITGVITNTGTVNAVWSQGNWGKELQKLYSPQCRPGVSGDQVVVTKPAVKVQPAPVAPKAPVADTVLKSTKDASYAPITFKSADTFQVQHLGDWIFRIKGWGVDTKAENFSCVWTDFTTGKVEPPWVEDSKVTCTWVPVAK